MSALLESPDHGLLVRLSSAGARFTGGLRVLNVLLIVIINGIGILAGAIVGTSALPTATE
jgi:hypothetical protein